MLTSDTRFVELFSYLNQSDFRGDKHYFNKFARDGGYMTISNSSGQRRFSNTFLGNDKSNIESDTIGLAKFEAISKYARGLQLKF